MSKRNQKPDFITVILSTYNAPLWLEKSLWGYAFQNHRDFEIVIADDGNGLTLDALADLVHHIGGSPKRTTNGVSLGVANKDDVTLSPGGRKLIGKIGIGLFAVAQLTRHFQIVTKIAGERFRRVADVKLRSFSENQLAGVMKIKGFHAALLFRA